MTTLNTLPSISTSLGLNRNTLSVLFSRADKRGEPRPRPVAHYGVNKGVAIYDTDEVEAWYVARTFEPRPRRGTDKQQRQRRTA